MGLFKKLFPTYSEKQIKNITPVIDEIEALADKYAAMTDAELRAMTDTLKGRECSMCAKCAARNATSKMRQAAGFVNGTQISRIKSSRLSVSNTSGVKGVYYDKRSGKWRARLKFKGKLMNFGSFDNFEDAVKARKNAELEYFGEFLDKN